MIAVIKKTIQSCDIGRQCLIPKYNSGAEKVFKITEGREILIQTKSGRNIMHHNLVFALIRLLKEHLDNDHPLKYSSEYIILKSMMSYIGLYEEVPNLQTGEVEKVIRSISFEKMSEEEFEPISDMMFKAVSDTAGIDEINLRREYIKYL